MAARRRRGHGLGRLPLRPEVVTTPKAVEAAVAGEDRRLVVNIEHVDDHARRRRQRRRGGVIHRVHDKRCLEVCSRLD